MITRFGNKYRPSNLKGVHYLVFEISAGIIFMTQADL